MCVHVYKRHSLTRQRRRVALNQIKMTVCILRILCTRGYGRTSHGTIIHTHTLTRRAQRRCDLLPAAAESCNTHTHTPKQLQELATRRRALCSRALEIGSATRDDDSRSRFGGRYVNLGTFRDEKRPLPSQARAVFLGHENSDKTLCTHILSGSFLAAVVKRSR